MYELKTEDIICDYDVGNIKQIIYWINLCFPSFEYDGTEAISGNIGGGFISTLINVHEYKNVKNAKMLINCCCLMLEGNLYDIYLINCDGTEFNDIQKWKQSLTVYT